MIDDEDEDHVPHKDIPESQDDEFARSIRVRDAARRAFIARLRRAAVSASRPDRLTFEPGDMRHFWRDGLGWRSWNGHRGVSSWSKATIMLTMVDGFSNNQLSNCHMSRNVSAWPKRLCENPRTPVETWIM